MNKQFSIFLILSFILTSKAQNSALSKIDTIVLGGGCYWCIEAIYQNIAGVESVESGYAGGKLTNPSYEEVSSGLTGHAEVVKITYNSEIIILEEILKIFFSIHDPTSLNRQGSDIGSQYRSVVFYTTEYQKKSTNYIIYTLNSTHIYNKPLVTEVMPLHKFYKAEEYHQNYYQKNRDQPYCRMVITPKLERFESVFKSKLKKS